MKIFFFVQNRASDKIFEHLLHMLISIRKNLFLFLLKIDDSLQKQQTCDILIETLLKMDPDEPEYYEVLQLFAFQTWKNNIKEYLNKGDEYALVVIKACAQEKIRILKTYFLHLF